jgi:hypothetical protein
VGLLKKVRLLRRGVPPEKIKVLSLLPGLRLPQSPAAPPKEHCDYSPEKAHAHFVIPTGVRRSIT